MFAGVPSELEGVDCTFWLFLNCMILPVPSPQLASEVGDVLNFLSGELYPLQQSPFVLLLPSQAVAAHYASSPCCLGPGWYRLSAFIVDWMAFSTPTNVPMGLLKATFTHHAPQSSFFYSVPLTQSLSSCWVPGIGAGHIQVNERSGLHYNRGRQKVNKLFFKYVRRCQIFWGK